MSANCLRAAVMALMVFSTAWADEAKEKDVNSPLDFKVKSIDGKPVDLSNYKGKVVLVVNVASKCGLTPQYKELQKLHDEFQDDGLAILEFPANDFLAQEPGSNEEIAAFCEKNYGVKFDLFEKVVVKGDGQCELYEFLTSEETNPKFAGDITWNFEKFLIGKDGQVVARFSPRAKPSSPEVVDAIKAELAK